MLNRVKTFDHNFQLKTERDLRLTLKSESVRWQDANKQLTNKINQTNTTLVRSYQGVTIAAR